MVILLPSKYTGGEVSFSHCGSNKTFDFSATSMTDSCVLAFYSDVQCTVGPVRTGYRLSLAYNLISTEPDSIPRIPAATTSSEELARIFEEWQKGSYVHDADTNVLAYILDGDYMPSVSKGGAISFSDSDAMTLANLQPPATQHGYTICLGGLTCQVSGEGEGHMDEDDEDEDDPYYGGFYGHHKRMRYNHYGDYDDEVPDMAEEYSRDYFVEDLIDISTATRFLQGHQRLTLDDDQVLPSDPFDGVEPDDQSVDRDGRVSILWLFNYIDTDNDPQNCTVNHSAFYLYY